METIKIECKSCRGTGLYQGFAEKKNEAVICIDCGGSGWILFKYDPFVKRKKTQGIETIRMSQGGFLVDGVGGPGESIPYSEFEKLYPV